ncbi:hypothetical protein NE237_003317 [Protea cynaroides]|uniref:Ribosome-associated protein quality control protein P2 RNA-binding domain-containing protein n=1 Tax=Protea cynaroides TaxID=273540 RepID=A0A9Q0KGH4_9MAGN|nr:hypothetical protein NE237_003317 [Protea cynaroides]
MAANSFTAPAILRKAIKAVINHRPLHSHKLSRYGIILGSVPLVTKPRNSSGICSVPNAKKWEDTDALYGVGDKNAREAVKHILEMVFAYLSASQFHKARRASSRREVLHTDFLNPPILKEPMLALEKLANIKAVAQGRYPQAQRSWLSVGHSEVMTTDPDIVGALSITGNFGFQPCSHGDFLGAILGTGIAREKLGDILLQVPSSID